MGIFKTKKGYKVKSYTTGKFHKKVYKTKAAAIRASGKQYRRYN